MNTLRMKLTPRPNAGTEEIAFYSCPDIKGDPEKTLKHVQKTANDRNVAFDYALVSDRDYFAVRGAREWRLSEPGDFDADQLFRVKLVRAGFVSSASQVTSLGMTGHDDITVRTCSEFEVMTINTMTGDVQVDPIMRADNTLRGPAS